MKKLHILAMIAIALMGAGCAGIENKAQSTNQTSATSQQKRPVHVVDIKYRETPVNLWNDKLVEGELHDSSFVWGAFYDADDEYMILNLDDIYYHYCSVPSDVWEGILDAESHGTYYNAAIKGQYSCEGKNAPNLE